jgi:hypothetical protein
MTNQTRPETKGPQTQATEDGELERDDDTVDFEEEDDDEEELSEEEEVPRVIIASVADLGSWVPETISKKYASRPIWFIVEQDAESVGLFSRYPEGPMPKTASDAILSGLRAFSLDQNEELQAVLGITDGLRYGFHVDASLEEVMESFEDDGFEVVTAIHEGRVDIEEGAE